MHFARLCELAHRLIPGSGPCFQSFVPPAPKQLTAAQNEQEKKRKERAHNRGARTCFRDCRMPCPAPTAANASAAPPKTN
eukprot:215969-Rhodomonas_salina.1